MKHQQISKAGVFKQSQATIAPTDVVSPPGGYSDEKKNSISSFNLIQQLMVF